MLGLGCSFSYLRERLCVACRHLACCLCWKAPAVQLARILEEKHLLMPRQLQVRSFTNVAFGVDKVLKGNSPSFLWVDAAVCTMGLFR